jgi:hypothetical protein
MLETIGGFATRSRPRERSVHGTVTLVADPCRVRAHAAGNTGDSYVILAASIMRAMASRCSCKGARAAIISALVLSASPDIAGAHSHKNADGTTVSWYPTECCHDGDCRPVAKIVRAPHGLWMTTVDGNTVLVGPNNRRLPSRDLRWHVCINQDIEATPDAIRCVFEPPDS